LPEKAQAFKQAFSVPPLPLMQTVGQSLPKVKLAAIRKHKK